MKCWMPVALMMMAPLTASAAEWDIASPRDFIKTAQETITAPESPQAKPIPARYAHDPGMTFAVIDGHPPDSGDPLARTTVAIIINPGSDHAQTCTGTIVAKDLVLTAAHCIIAAPSDMMIHFGPNAKQPIAKSRIRDHRIYPGFGKKFVFFRERTEHDIALVQIIGALPDGYHEADLGIDPRELKIGIPVEIAGYGNRHVGIESMGSLLQTTLEVTYIDEGHILVLADPTGGNHGSCDGDSGGPAALRTAQGLKVIGVASSAPRGCGMGEWLTLPNLEAVPNSAIYTIISAPENAEFIRAAANELHSSAAPLGWRE